MSCRLSNPESDSIALHDPEFTLERPVGKDRDQPLDEAQNGLLVLVLRTNDDDPSLFRRWVRPDIGEVQIQRDQGPVLGTGVGE